MDVRVRELAAGQDDVVAAWQLLAAGLTREAIVHRVCKSGWRVVHAGVYALNSAPLTQRQRWIAATLTSPDSVLSHASAAACWGIRPFEGSYEVVTRPGSGGRRRLGGVLVLRSTTLKGYTTTHDRIGVTSAPRTLIDLAPNVSSRDLRRAFREAHRLKTTTSQQLLSALESHHGGRGTRNLRDLATRYRAIPYRRTRSDAEGRALEVLHDAGIPQPRTNIRIAGEEADLVWTAERLILEIDGPQYHQFHVEDARKHRAWERRGYVVRRISSDVVYRDPARVVALARVP
jgi:very-short-patch-repair endonuclease